MCNQETLEQLENFINESTLLELLGVEKVTLDTLRQKKGLPFIRVTDRVRLYRESSVVGWLQQHEMIAGESMAEE